MMNTRYLEHTIPGLLTSDGAGVKLRRSLGQNALTRLDPFLMLDEFSSDKPDDYIAGFPPHPHRGFETVTYMLEGHMLHEDHMGNKGHLNSGDVQWMTAGRGIIHSEMPQQEQGLMRGFQLWINLPAKEKMKPASYQDIPANRIPVVTQPNGTRIKIIAGTFENTQGPIQGLSTAPIYLDVHLPAATPFSYALPAEHNTFIYVYEGEITIGSEQQAKTLHPHQAGILSQGEQLDIFTGKSSAQFLILAGKPLKEPVEQRGPFVMNTREEIEQAMYDYQHGQLV